MAQRKALNRGLNDLLGDVSGVYEKSFDFSSDSGLDSNLDSKDSKRVVKLKVDSIKPNPAQPRANFDKESLENLAQSIKTHGILQPIIVLKDAKDSYTLIAGERRLRAAKSLNMESIDSIIVDFEAYKLRELALIENIQRENLNAIELAKCYKALIDEHNLTHEQLATRINKSRAAITNTLRLLELSEATQNLISEGKITQGHAKVMVGLSSENEKIIAQSIVGQNLSVREVEKMVGTDAAEELGFEL